MGGPEDTAPLSTSSTLFFSTQTPPPRNGNSPLLWPAQDPTHRGRAGPPRAPGESYAATFRERHVGSSGRSHSQAPQRTIRRGAARTAALWHVTQELDQAWRAFATELRRHRHGSTYAIWLRRAAPARRARRATNLTPVTGPHYRAAHMGNERNGTILQGGGVRSNSAPTPASPKIVRARAATYPQRNRPRAHAEGGTPRRHFFAGIPRRGAGAQVQRAPELSTSSIGRLNRLAHAAGGSSRRRGTPGSALQPMYIWPARPGLSARKRNLLHARQETTFSRISAGPSVALPRTVPRTLRNDSSVLGASPSATRSISRARCSRPNGNVLLIDRSPVPRARK